MLKPAIHMAATLLCALVVLLCVVHAQAAPRFTMPSEGVVMDNRTGLMWFSDAGTSDKPMPYEMAGEFISKLNEDKALGYSDWRLPTVEEMLSLVDTSRQYPAIVQGGRFTAVAPDYYWTSTTGVNIIPYAWIVDMGTGASRYEEISYCNMHGLWPVRTEDAEAWDSPSSNKARSVAAKARQLPTFIDTLASEGMDKPLAPSGISVVPVSTDEVSISWLPIPDKKGVWYNLYEDGRHLRSTDKPPLRIGGLEPETTKCYYVTVRIGGGPESSPSREICATTWANNIQKGAVLAMGLNNYGQLGDGSKLDTALPVLANGLEDVVKVAAGVEHALAVKSDGTVWAWGRNTRGQLGNGSNIGSDVPVMVHGLEGIVDVAAGWYHSLALAGDGTVWAWGRNYYGQLGTGDNADSHVPVKVKGLNGIKQIAAGWYHSMALAGGGKIMLWGWNRNGQLGEEDMQMSDEPRKLAPKLPAIDITAGMQHSAALLTDGTVIAWGRNDYSQLGASTVGDSYYPVAVEGLKDVADIDCDMHFCLALRKDGAVMGWGRNDYGQVKDDPSGIIDRASPSGAEGVFTMISAGAHQSLAMRQDGELWAWGWDYAGDVQKSAPAPITAIKGFMAVSSGIHFNIMIKGE